MCGIWNNDQPFPSTPKVMEVSTGREICWPFLVIQNTESRAVRPTNTFFAGRKVVRMQMHLTLAP